MSSSQRAEGPAESWKLKPQPRLTLDGRGAGSWGTNTERGTKTKMEGNRKYKKVRGINRGLANKGDDEVWVKKEEKKDKE